MSTETTAFTTAAEGLTAEGIAHLKLRSKYVPLDQVTPDIMRAQSKSAIVTLPNHIPLAVMDCDGVPVGIHVPETYQTNPPKCIYINYHGGGWVIGSMLNVAHCSSTVAATANAVVLAVDYRMGPEHRFPAAVDDCIKVAALALDDPTRFHAAADAIVGVGGDSAGGNLAAVVAQQLRGRSGRQLDFQVLIYPSTHMGFRTESCQKFAEGFGLSMELCLWFRKMYLNDDSEITDVRASPELCEDLSNLPSCLTVAASHDMLHDESITYAQRLKAAGVPVEVKEFAGVLHGFFNLPALYPQALEAHASVANFIASRVAASFQ